jgi:hypothetical protein
MRRAQRSQLWWRSGAAIVGSGWLILAAGGVPAAAAAPWWVRSGLDGVALSAVAADGAGVVVRTTAGATLRSDDGGGTFAHVPGDPPLSVRPLARSGGDTWTIDSNGAVLHAHGSGALTQDGGAPNLGAGARLIAAPASMPGAVVAVATDGTVWRRKSGSGWARALLLLPAGLVSGVPRVTALAAFTRPLSGAVYLATEGYSVLISADGGDDWIRASPGLPDDVFGLAADSTTMSLYAATSDGLFVHHLRALPSPPAYRDSALVLRWVGIGVVVLATTLLAAALLSRLAGPRSNPHTS